MEFLVNSFFKALDLIIHLDAELLGIVLLSLKVSGTAAFLATAIGIGLTLFLSTTDFPGRNILVNVINTSMGLPPVVVGLVLYLILSRSGPMGFMHLLYTPSAMIIAQVVLATPIIAGLSLSSMESADPSVRFAARSLGATPFQATLRVFKDIRYEFLAAVMAGFGRVMAEVGAVLIVGGNIAGYTRVMTTTIALEADKGDFELAVALGVVLLAIAFLINGVLHLFQRRGARR
jgi:tungstate transport system permease protein